MQRVPGAGGEFEGAALIQAADSLGEEETPAWVRLRTPSAMLVGKSFPFVMAAENRGQRTVFANIRNNWDLTRLSIREGNGRAARILSILMALQAGLPPLDFSVIAAEKRQDYFSAVQAGLDKDYAPMERLFAGIIERSLAAS